MPTIKQSYEMDASPEQVFNALVNPDVIQYWSEDEAKMGAETGSAFSLWGGQMFGTNMEVVKNKKLVQEWCYDKWETPSKVTFTLKGKGKKTIVNLLHEEVPQESLHIISESWEQYYLGAIKRMFEKKK